MASQHVCCTKQHMNFGMQIAADTPMPGLPRSSSACKLQELVQQSPPA